MRDQATLCLGYMDPGNWATDLAGRARFGYALKRHPVVQRHGRFDAINSVSDWGLLLRAGLAQA